MNTAAKVKNYYTVNKRFRVRDDDAFNAPCIKFDTVVRAKFYANQTLLEAASDEEAKALFKQPQHYALRGRSAFIYTDERLYQMVKEIRAVTGLWPMPNDVRCEKAYRLCGGTASLTYGELINVMHLLVVTGRKSTNGHYGPANIKATSHWISNCSTRTRPNEPHPKSLHTRLTFNNSTYMSAHHISYATFISRDAIVLCQKARVNGKVPPKADLLLQCSHRCHVDACIHPEHLTLETSGMNLDRTKCCTGMVCLQDVHQGLQCIFTDINKSRIRRLVKIKRLPVTYSGRMRQLDEEEMEDDEVDVRATNLIAMLRNPETREAALLAYEAGLQALEEEDGAVPMEI